MANRVKLAEAVSISSPAEPKVGAYPCPDSSNHFHPARALWAKLLDPAKLCSNFVGASGEFVAELYIKKMKRLMDFGRRALFYIRVLSGYEERKIRNHRLQLEQRLRQAQERKEALRKIPEQFILSEVRRMVEEMQNLNKKIDEIEATFDDYFKPINKQAEIIMKTQLEGEENSMKDMMKAMQTRALLEKFEAERKAKVNGADAETKANVNDADANQINQETGPTTKQHAQLSLLYFEYTGMIGFATRMIVVIDLCFGTKFYSTNDCNVMNIISNEYNGAKA
ncbi:hypothetical protein SADUNF_Sadunf12G0025700 [Salix dunnii]|uniref:Uncharacterized protein n=1 Tax=Salix dunnii TaxID=1413687 RepID=A0A835JMN5_9ROSI|nr:hypothetical protein SADUNF_Sadunf12G0025700 [Salix dunnii]